MEAWKFKVVGYARLELLIVQPTTLEQLQVCYVCFPLGRSTFNLCVKGYTLIPQKEPYFCTSCPILLSIPRMRRSSGSTGPDAVGDGQITSGQLCQPFIKRTFLKLPSKCITHPRRLGRLRYGTYIIQVNHSRLTLKFIL